MSTHWWGSFLAVQATMETVLFVLIARGVVISIVGWRLLPILILKNLVPPLMIIFNHTTSILLPLLDYVILQLSLNYFILLILGGPLLFMERRFLLLPYIRNAAFLCDRILARSFFARGPPELLAWIKLVVVHKAVWRVRIVCVLNIAWI